MLAAVSLFSFSRSLAPRSCNRARCFFSSGPLGDLPPPLCPPGFRTVRNVAPPLFFFSGKRTRADLWFHSLFFFWRRLQPLPIFFFFFCCDPGREGFSPLFSFAPTYQIEPLGFPFFFFWLARDIPNGFTLPTPCLPLGFLTLAFFSPSFSYRGTG